jgi:uncharacterized membrane protein
MTTLSGVPPTDTRPSHESSKRTDRALDTAAWGIVAIYTVLVVPRSIGLDIGGAVALLALLPAAFMLVHGTRAFGFRTAIVFGAITFVVSNTFENLSVATGFPFGNYHYSASFAGPKLLEVPLLVGPSYLGMGYLSWTLGRLLLGRTQPAHGGAMLIALPIVASFVMVAWDLTADPVASTIRGLWVWEQGGSYFGVPLSNFLGWFLTVFTFFALFAVYVSRRAPAGTNSRQLSGQNWLQAIALYAAAAIPALLGPLTDSAVGTVTDPTGTVWRTADLHQSVALVAIFTMVAFAVLGALRALDHAPADP